MKIRWLGQSGFVLEHERRRLVIDPYLSDSLAHLQGLHRLFPPPVSLAQLQPHAVFITHDHLDHFDPETLVPLMEMYADCKFIGPKSALQHARKLGFAESQLISICPGQTVQTEGFTLTATPAYHSDKFAVGLLVAAAGRLLYFSGDTLYTPALAAQIREHMSRSLGAAFVCINGKLNNMNLREAAEFMTELSPELAVPMHYGLFAENTADPNEFIAACTARQQPAIALELGKSFTLSSLLKRDAAFDQFPASTPQLKR
jgi:L-ascorbate 6-phosphate lactonase